MHYRPALKVCLPQTLDFCVPSNDGLGSPSAWRSSHISHSGRVFHPCGCVGGTSDCLSGWNLSRTGCTCKVFPPCGPHSESSAPTGWRKSSRTLGTTCWFSGTGLEGRNCASSACSCEESAARKCCKSWTCATSCGVLECPCERMTCYISDRWICVY